MKEKIRGLDGLKGIIAIFIAYVYHYFILFEVDPFQSVPILDKTFNFINVYTGYSEAVFFLLSGFLMAYVYEERVKHQNIWEFFVPRVKKMYPIMIITVFLVFVLENLGRLWLGEYPLHGENGDIQYGWLSLLVSCFGVQTGYFSDGDLHSVNGPAWYISILFLCYLISFFVIKTVKTEKQRLACFSGMFLLGVIICIHYGFDYPLLYSCCGRGFISFFLGCLMEKFVNRQKRLGIVRALVLIIVIIVMLYLTETMFVSQRMVLTELFVYPVTVYLVLKVRPIQRVLDKKIPRFLGRISLFMYLWNFPIFVGIAFVNRVFDLHMVFGNPFVWLTITLVSIFISACVEKLNRVLLKSGH